MCKVRCSIENVTVDWGDHFWWRLGDPHTDYQGRQKYSDCVQQLAHRKLSILKQKPHFLMFEGPPQKKLGATWAPQLYAVKFRGGPILYPGADPRNSEGVVRLRSRLRYWKRTFPHRFKPCRFGDVLRGTGSRNMASFIDSQMNCARRWLFLQWNVEFHVVYCAIQEEHLPPRFKPCTFSDGLRGPGNRNKASFVVSQLNYPRRWMFM